MRAATLLLLSLTLVTLPVLAQARPSRPPERSPAAWVSECSRQSGIEFELIRNLPGLALVGMKSAADPRDMHQIELSSPPRHAFRVVDQVGLSPVAEVPDWSSAPEEFQEGLDALQSCVTTLGAPRLGGRTVVLRPQYKLAQRGQELPWRMGLALMAGAFALVVGWRRPERKDLLSLGLIPLTFAFRWLLAPLAYLHQNGQGPLWVSYALGEASPYGSGFRALYSTLLLGADHPDQRLLLTHAWAGACIPFLIFVSTRSLGLSRRFSWILSLAVATSPAFIRTAHSESYFAVTTFMVSLAGALLCWVFASLSLLENRLRAPFFLAGVGAAGCLVAQLALVHPFGWLPAAFLPALVLLRPSPEEFRGVRDWSGFKKLLLNTGLVTLGIAAVVALLSGFEMQSILQGELGQQWLSGAQSHGAPPDLKLLGLAALGLIAASQAPQHRQVALALFTGVLVYTAMEFSSPILLHTNPGLRAAHNTMYWPLLLTAFGAGLNSLSPHLPARAGLVLVALILTVNAGTARAVFDYPTDTREGSFALAWKESLPPGGRVVWLERSGRRVLTLPVRPPQFSVGILALSEDDLEKASQIEAPQLEAGSFYYRSSLCSTAEAAEYCQRIEEAYRLRLQKKAVFPAISSLSDLSYLDSTVEVALFEVLGPKSSDYEHTSGTRDD